MNFNNLDNDVKLFIKVFMAGVILGVVIIVLGHALGLM